MTSAQPKSKSKPKTTPTAEKPATPQPPEINYKVSMPQPFTHLLEVEMRLRAPQNATLGETTDIMMPVWTPGSYLIREYARHIQDFAAKDAGGNALVWEKTNKNTWQIQTKAATETVITYRVYANELTVRTNELNDYHAFWNNAALLMYPKGFLNAPSTLKVEPFGNWKIATGLEPLRTPNTFYAENFDILYDSPFEVGDFKEISFDVNGVSHRIVMEGEGNYNLEKVRDDVKKIVEAAAKIFGELPYKNYTFIVNLRGGGGLEHLNSTALQFNRFGFTARYNDFLTLVAHEFFHAWNVKRIRPDALGPFDYNNENYTKLLWVAEGGTAYYENVLVQRAGLITDKQFLAGRATTIQDLQRRPGRFQTSLEEASFDAWIKYYRQDENAINNQISYYDKGEIVNWLLDLEIRQATAGAKSLDDVMRFLYTDFYKKGKNYTPADYQKTCETVAGKSLDDFFRKYVRGREEIDFNSIVAAYGLKLETSPANAKEQAYIGADFAQQGENLTIRAVPADTPAYLQGLNAGDQIVAIEGFRANLDFLNARLSERKAGDKLRITLFRNDELRNVEITLGSRVAPSYRFSFVENPNEDQKALYKNYFGAELK